MGKFNRMIVIYSDSENSCDSLQLIDPVTNLSLEQIEITHDFDDQTNQFAKLHLNDLNSSVDKRRKKHSKKSRHHPYQKPKKSPIKKKDHYDMNFLKSLGYLQYSSNKIRISEKKKSDEFLVQITETIRSTLSKYLNKKEKAIDYICNRRDYH